MIGGIIGDIIFILYLLAILISLVMRGLIQPYFAVFALFLLIFFRARGRLAGGVLGSFVRGTFTICLPILSLAILAVRYSQGTLEHFSLMMGLLIALFLTILGIYIMVWGAFSSPKGILWSIPGLLSIMVFVLDLTLEGYIPSSQAALGIVLLVLLRGIGHLLGKRTEETVRTTFKFSLPLCLLAFFILIVMVTKTGMPLDTSLGIIFTLAILFIVFYLITSGPPFRWRR